MPLVLAAVAVATIPIAIICMKNEWLRPTRGLSKMTEPEDKRGRARQKNQVGLETIKRSEPPETNKALWR